jgi:hypothetical protein
MHVLEQMLPYPGDESPEEGRRFLVYQFEELYVIMHQDLCVDEHINKNLLLDKEYNLPKWYADRCIAC